MSQDFEKRTQEVLEESAARLDGRTRSRLTQARHAALAQLEKPARSRWRSYVPAGAATAAAVLAVVVYTGRPETGLPIATTSVVIDDTEMLADADSEFVSEGDDVEFYEWAAGEMET
jgi:hypothetical protein